MGAWKDMDGARRRRQPRTEVRLDCLLTRRKGSPVAGHTLEVGPAGMCVETERPLGVDEVLHFDVAGVDGDARVLREHAPNVYALRIEAIEDGAAARLRDLGG